MDESKGTLAIASKLRMAYIETRNGTEFVKYARLAFGMDEFTAKLIWETIDAVCLRLE